MEATEPKKVKVEGNGFMESFLAFPRQTSPNAKFNKDLFLWDHSYNKQGPQSLEKNHTNFSGVNVKNFFKSTNLSHQVQPIFLHPSALICNECSAVAFGSTKTSELVFFKIWMASIFKKSNGSNHS